MPALVLFARWIPVLIAITLAESAAALPNNVDWIAFEDDLAAELWAWDAQTPYHFTGASLQCQQLAGQYPGAEDECQQLVCDAFAGTMDLRFGGEWDFEPVGLVSDGLDTCTSWGVAWGEEG